jgi:hypothetical protein
MYELVTISDAGQNDVYPSEELAKPFRFGTNGLVILTNATALLPDEQNRFKHPRLDDDLRRLICACLSPLPHQRPRLVSLVNQVKYNIRIRDAPFYLRHGIMGESDEEINFLIQQLLFNAS